MNDFKRKRLQITLVLAPTLFAGSLRADGIVDSIVNAPISADGNVAGAVTDWVINLDTPMNPEVQGRSLLAGNTIKIVLPDDFIDQETLPTETVFSSATCTIGNFQCNTSVFVQGWPQKPILPVAPPIEGSAVYSLTMEGTHTFVHTADVNVVPGLAAPGPGIKQIHMILPGFRNPAAGMYEIQVIAETGPDGTVETGSAFVEILPEIQPSINVTSIYNDGNPNTIFQTVQQGEVAPLNYDFFIWDEEGTAFTGVEIEDGMLKQGENVVGQVSIEAPPGAVGHEVFTGGPSVLVNEPFFGAETGRLTAFFRAGDVNGEYVTTFSLNNGNSVQMFAEVVPESGSFGLAIVAFLAIVRCFRARRR